MKRLSLLFLVATACTKPKPVATSPLPPDKPTEQIVPAEKEKPAARPEPPAPSGPLDAAIPASTTKVKLMSAGKGKREKLVLSAKQGAKQDVELALDLALKQSAGAKSVEDVVPTILLGGSAETKTADASGLSYALVISSTDAREAAGAKIPLDKFKAALTSLVGMTIGGSVGADGQTGEITMHVDKQTIDTIQAFQLLRLTIPSWPVFPTEPVGSGAKWKTTTTQRLANGIEVDRVTDYELVSHKDGQWTIKGATKVSGKDQETGVGDGKAKVSKITGTGTSEVTLADGALYPSHTTKLETTFTASDPSGAQSIDFAIKVGSVVKAK